MTERSSRSAVDLFWRRPYALLLLSPLFWAGNLLIARAYGDALPPFGLAFWRWIVALAFLLPFVWRDLAAHAKEMSKHWPVIVGCGLTGFVGYPVLNYVALHSTPAATASMLNSALPLMIPLLAWGVAGEVPSLRTIVGIAISFIGVGIIVSRGDWSVLSSFSIGFGETIMLVAVACFALYSTLLRYRPAALPDKLFLAATMAASAVLLLPFAVGEAASGRAFPVQPGAIVSLLFIGLFASLIANVFWTQCVATLGPTLTGASFHLMAAYASVLAYVLLGEPIRLFHLAGISLILVGFAVAILPARAARRASAELAAAGRRR